MPDLLPCPFCGGEADLAITETRSGNLEFFDVYCTEGCCNTGRNEVLEEAISTWNNRAKLAE